MANYLEMAQGIVAEVWDSPAMQGIIRQGHYKRVIPSTPGVTGTTLESPLIPVLRYQFSGEGPMTDLWKVKDRVVMIQQIDLTAFGEPQEKDQLTLVACSQTGAPEAHYEVLRGWEESPGLMWHIQVRN